mgnify:CR=1 FL=1
MGTDGWKGKLQRLAPLPVRKQSVRSGEPHTVFVELAGDLSATNSIAAIRELHQNGAELLDAKRAIERALEAETATLYLATVQNLSELQDALNRHGFICSVVTNPPRSAATIRLR